MDILLSEQGQQLIITLSGKLDQAHATALSERLLKLCEQRLKPEVIIDLGQCEEIGSLGFGALVGFRLSPPIAPLPVRIVAANAQVLRDMHLLRLEKIFDIAVQENT